MKATWRKRYSGPGYPIDPNSNELFDEYYGRDDSAYKCVMIPPPQMTLHSQIWEMTANIYQFEMISGGETEPWMRGVIIKPV
jgi:hypothetical protein